ncbi:MAG: hypothetical protein Q7T78_15910 [Rhodoferax sp.]|nr:hypothetical protein [Rhodoferax sp.]
MQQRRVQKTGGQPTILCRSHPTSGLSLVQFHPAGCDGSQTCAAIWEEHDHVHLASPLLRKRAGILDPQPFIKKFPCAIGMVDAFERAMEWLDSVCYAAQATAQVRQACEAEPEWGLRCTRYDASDQTLGLGGLGQALLPDEALIEEVARQCLAQTIKRLLKEDPDFKDGQMDVMETGADNGDVATVYLPNGLSIRVCLLKKVSRPEVIQCGIHAMNRMSQTDATWQHALLVMPGLDLETPMVMGKSVTISSLEFGVIRAALLALVSQDA